MTFCELKWPEQLCWCFYLFLHYDVLFLCWFFQWDI